MSVEFFWGNYSPTDLPIPFMNIEFHTEKLQIELTSAILEGLWDGNYLSFLSIYFFWCSISASNILKTETNWAIRVRSTCAK